MAWLATTIPALPGSGIVYTLTQRDAERVAEWLRDNGIVAEAYHAGLSDEDESAPRREQLEQRLLRNEIKVLVATVALGMGFDKPDFGFVIHFQRPASVVHYYQQVGRAGRAVDEAYGILLHGEEDDHIADFFIRSAFPPQKHIADILGALDSADGGLSITALSSRLNLRRGQIDKTIKFLTVESPSPVVKLEKKWHATPAARHYEIDKGHVDEILGIRRREQTQMQEYMGHGGCLMAFLEKALDDPDPRDCGKCRNCAPDLLLSEDIIMVNLASKAALFLKRSYREITPRKQWPYYNAMKAYGFSGRIDASLQASEGRALSLWRDAGWGQMVQPGTSMKQAGLVIPLCWHVLRSLRNGVLRPGHSGLPVSPRLGIRSWCPTSQSGSLRHSAFHSFRASLKIDRTASRNQWKTASSRLGISMAFSASGGR